MNDVPTWLNTHTFHHSDFSDLTALVEKKQEKGLRISLCFPTLNEEETIAKEIVIMRSELMARHPLIDEIAVIDSGSGDKTREVAKAYGAEVYPAADILPDLPAYCGKGENLWKALYMLKGDIIIYIDADIKNIHHRFAYGLVGPLLKDDGIKFVKAFYDRPITMDARKIKPTGGGRVTELVVRPLFSLFIPELAQIIQPLSGEYAGRREIFESISFPIGYGIETSMLIDIYQKWGMDIMAQVDLDKRVHRNQSTLALGRMAFGIMQTFLKRLEKDGNISLKEELKSRMVQFSVANGIYTEEVFEALVRERPPIAELPEYISKFGSGK